MQFVANLCSFPVLPALGFSTLQSLYFIWKVCDFMSVAPRFVPFHVARATPSGAGAVVPNAATMAMQGPRNVGVQPQQAGLSPYVG